MATDALLRCSTQHLRVKTWHGRDDIAHLTPVSTPGRLTLATIETTVRHLADVGTHRAVTAAVGPADAATFESAGFEVLEHLSLLRHDLRTIRGASVAPTLRRAGRKDRVAVLDVDRAAFSGFWRMDATAIADAVRATPHARFRVADAGSVVGYAITGRAGVHGFLQRLAVEPEHQGRGIATALVADGLRWLRRRGATSALVNTQVINERAFALYRHLGFEPEPHGLTVLHLGAAP